MQKLLSILCIIFTITNVNAQSKYGLQWINGLRGNIIDFRNNYITTKMGIYPFKYFYQGCSNICDTNGNLILCSDGYNIYDTYANYIDGGDSIVPKDHLIAKSGFSIYSQSSIFLPMDSNQFYFITPAFSDSQFADCQANSNCYFDLLLYNVIDMNANGGAGKVVKRMQVLMDSASLSKTQMMACRHANGKDWWLLKQGGGSNIVYKFLFTQDSIYDYGSQVFNAPYWGVWDIKGQSVFRKDGSQYATTVQGNSTGEVFIADFDRCYGILNNAKVIVMPIGSQYDPFDTTITERIPAGLAYSPNGQLLYVISPHNIWQYDLQDNTWYHVAGLDTTYQKFKGYSASYLGPNDKLYVGNDAGTGKQMSVIDNPDVEGVGCNFCRRCLRLDTLGVNEGFVGTPPCMPNYSLGSQVCWALENSEIFVVSSEIEVYPNPANTTLFIRNAPSDRRTGKGNIKFFNSIGQLIFSTEMNEIDVRNLPKGIYYLKAGNAVKKIVIE